MVYLLLLGVKVNLIINQDRVADISKRTARYALVFARETSVSRSVPIPKTQHTKNHFTIQENCSIIRLSFWKRERSIKMDVNELMKSEDYTRNYDIQDISANKLMGVLAYLGILVLVPIFTARQSRFSMFHAEQGITLAIGECALSVLMTIFSFIPFGWVINIFLALIGLVFLLLAILGIINSANGQAKELPLIGKIKIVKLQ